MCIRDRAENRSPAGGQSPDPARLAVGRLHPRAGPRHRPPHPIPGPAHRHHRDPGGARGRGHWACPHPLPARLPHRPGRPVPAPRPTWPPANMTWAAARRMHNNLRSAASDHNTPEISGRRHTGTTLKAHEQERASTRSCRRSDDVGRPVCASGWRLRACLKAGQGPCSVTCCDLLAAGARGFAPDSTGSR